MAFVNAGIKEVYFTPSKIAFPALTSSGVYTNVFGFGVRQNGSLVGNHFQEIRDNKNRVFPNLFNFKLDMPTMQIDNPLLIGALITAAKNGGAAVACVTSGVSRSAAPYTVGSSAGGIFVFDADNSLGIDFELKFGLKERLCTVNFERAFKYGTTANSGGDSHYEIIEAAATNSLKWVTDTLPNVIVANVIDEFVSPDFIPTGSLSSLSDAFADMNLVDFSLSIKTKSSKNGFNGSMVSGLQVELMAQAMGADINAILDAVEYEMHANASPIAVDLGTTTINLYKNNLSRIGDFEISDDNRNVKFTYTGEYDLDYTAVSGNNINLYSSLEV
jgi:hypothetical protein